MAKTVSRQAVRQRAQALGRGATPKVEDDLIDEVTDANVQALDDVIERSARPAVRESVRDEPLPAGAVRGRNGEVLARSRTSIDNKYHLPPECCEPGWSYEWKRDTIFNQPDQSYTNQLMHNGWRPVMAVGAWSGVFTPSDWKGEIRIDGEILMERPAELTRQAYAEERKKAQDLMRNSTQGLRLNMPSGFSTDHAGVQPKLNQTYEQGPAPSKRNLMSD